MLYDMNYSDRTDCKHISDVSNLKDRDEKDHKESD